MQYKFGHLSLVGAFKPTRATRSESHFLVAETATWLYKLTLCQKGSSIIFSDCYNKAISTGGNVYLTRLFLKSRWVCIGEENQDIVGYIDRKRSRWCCRVDATKGITG